jgi:hypothetical protein
MTNPPILRRLGNKLIAADELISGFDRYGALLEGVNSRLETSEQLSHKLDARTEALASQFQREQQTLRAMVEQLSDQLHQRFEHLQEKLHAGLSQLPSRSQLNESLAALPDQFKRNYVDLRHYYTGHDQAPRLRPLVRPHASTEPVIDKIAFLVHSKELLNHFSCIWDALPQGSFDVVLHGEADLPTTEAFEPWHCQVSHTTDVLGKGLKYRYLVSNHPVDASGEPLIKRLAQINVRFMYAAGKSGWNLSNWNSLYDVILCFGPYHAEYFSRHTTATIVQIGYPRLDRYFSPSQDAATLSSAFGCSPEKKTIVWLPTHGTISSLGHFDEEIAALTEHYNVLVKVHPLTPQSDPAAIETLSRLPFTRLILDATDNLPLYKIADYMLFDYGGPPLAGIYTNKKMILLNVPGADQDSLIGQYSPDALLRNYIVAVEPQMRTIAALLEDDSTWHQQTQIRSDLRSLYFAPYFGFSTQVAAQTLLNLGRVLE